MQRKIFDCTTFYQANFLFKMRFEILKDYVDYFVVCEANRTHVGTKKNSTLILKSQINIRKRLFILRLLIYQKLKLKIKKSIDYYVYKWKTCLKELKMQTMTI